MAQNRAELDLTHWIYPKDTGHLQHIGGRKGLQLCVETEDGGMVSAALTSSMAEKRKRERARYFAANPELADAAERWSRYEALILAKYGGKDLDAAWAARDRAHWSRVR